MDYELYRKLAHSEIEPAFYMLRWVRALFSQDFHLDQIVQIWDALICAPNGLDSVPVFCLAMLEYIRFEILGAHGFLVLRALSGYPTLVTVSPLIGLFRQLQAAVQKGDVLLDFSPAASSSGIRVPQSASLFPHVHVSRRALPHTRLRIVSGAKRPETAIKSVSDDDFRVPRAATQGGIRRIESAPSLSSLALPLAPPPAPRLSAPFHAMPQIISEEVAELFEELPVWQPHGSLPSTVLVREASRSFSPPAEAADPCSMQTLPAVSVHEPEKFEGPAASLLRGYSELVFEWIDPAPIPLLESTAIHSELPSHALPPLPRSSSVSNLSSASLQTRPLQLTPFIDHVSLASTAERNVTLAAKTLARTHHSLNSSSFSPRAVQHDARLIPARVSNVPVVHVKHVAIPSARALTSHMRSSSSPSLSALVQSSASAAAHVVQPHCRNLFDAAALSSHSPSTDGVFAVHSPPRALRKSAFSSSFGSLSTLAESPLSDARVSTELFASSHRIDSLFAPDSKAASELDSDDEAACRSAAVLVDAAHVVIDESFFALKQSDSPTPHSPAHQHHHSHHHIDLLLTDSDPLVPLSSAWPHESGAAHLSLHAEPPSSFALRHDAEAAAPVHVKSPSQLPPPSVSVRFDNALAIGARFTADAAESEPRAPSPASGSEDASRVVGVDIEEDCEFADEISSSGFAFRYRGYLVLFDRVAHSAATVLRRVYVKIKNGALQIFANSQCADRLDSIPLAACVVHVAPVAEASPDLMHPIALAPVAPAVAHGGDTGTADLVAKETAPSSVAAAAAAAPLAAVSASASTAVERTPFCFHVQLSAPSGGGRDRLAFFARSRDELTRWVGSLQLASSIPLNDLGTSEIHRVIALLSDL